MRLRSLRQLTLVSFFVALIPLIALLVRSQTDLARVASMTADDNTFFVSVVSGSRALESDAIDVERLIRQYFVVQEPSIATLVNDALQKFNADVDALCELLASQPDSESLCEQLQSRLIRLSDFAQIDDQLLLDAHLGEFRDRVDSLRLEVGSAINDQITEQQTTIRELRTLQAWSTVSLALISLLLIIYASQLIVKPFKKLTHIIRKMAEQKSALPPLSTSGPRELVRVENDLHWLNDRLQQLENIRTALLRHAAHELKTPLASLKEGCALLNEQMVGELNSAQLEVVGLLISSTQRLNMLVEKLLDYNLLLQQAQPEFVKIDLNTIVDECLNENALALNQNNHKVVSDIGVQEVLVDVELCRRILDNLLSNAIAHGDSDAPIQLKAYILNGNLVIELANKGKKIQPEELSELFKPFVRGTEERKDNVIGAGLGLSIVADCARLMHGAVKVIDVEYADVCFQITIPQNTLR